MTQFSMRSITNAKKRPDQPVGALRVAGPPNTLGRELVVLSEVKQRENTSLGGVVLSEQEVGTLLGPAKCHFKCLM